MMTYVSSLVRRWGASAFVAACSTTCLFADEVPMPGATSAQEAKQAKDQEKFQALVQQAQDEIELDESLAGVMLLGAEFAQNEMSNAQIVRLQGKVADPAQMPKVEALVKNAMKADQYWWVGDGPREVSAESMKVSLGSPEWASRYYAQGLESFWKNDYAASNRAFAQAISEDSQDDVLRYWRAVAALAQGDTDRAKLKLRPLLNRYPLGSRTPFIAAAFERLQGPLRQQLMALETEMLSAP